MARRMFEFSRAIFIRRQLDVAVLREIVRRLASLSNFLSYSARVPSDSVGLTTLLLTNLLFAFIGMECEAVGTSGLVLLALGLFYVGGSESVSASGIIVFC